MENKKDKKRLALTSLLTLIISLLLDSIKVLQHTDYIVSYIVIFLFLNIILSD